MDRVLGIIGAPTSAGAFSLGQEKAPDALRRAGLIPRLRDAGLSVIDHGDIPGWRWRPDPGRPRAQNVGAVASSARSVAEEVMRMHEASDEARWVFRIGGASAVVGAILGGLGNLVHPVTPENDPVGVARVIADSAIWVPVHLSIVFGILLMLGGLVAVHHSIRGVVPGALARFGLFVAVAGATNRPGAGDPRRIAARQLAEEWASVAPDGKSTALGLVHVNETISFALASLFNFVFAAATFILFGLAVALSGVYPRWLGWVVFVAGVASVGAGLIQAYVGEPTGASRFLTIIGPTVITLWLLVIGILLRRMGRSESIESLAATSEPAVNGWRATG